MDVFWQELAEWWWAILLWIGIGIATFGSFVHSRLIAKDELKFEKIKSDNAQAKATRGIEASRERQEAMKLRALQIEHGLHTHYIPILDDVEPKTKPVPEIEPTPPKLTKKP